MPLNYLYQTSPDDYLHSAPTLDLGREALRLEGLDLDGSEDCEPKLEWAFIEDVEEDQIEDEVTLTRFEDSATVPGHRSAAGTMRAAVGTYVHRVTQLERHERATQKLRHQREDTLVGYPRMACIAPACKAPPAALGRASRPDLGAMIEDSLAQFRASDQRTMKKAKRQRAWPVLSLLAIMPWLFL